ncbi:MAG: DEAD/DEAH box helicase [Candidatus Eremiobacteraeota bacterium]|nr:DEAD/DEAH box helicase [Candidatus Eremiobacteraeota bacterium]
MPPPTASEAAFEAVLAEFVGRSSDAGDAGTRDAFVERAFAKSAEYLHDRFARIGEATTFHTKIAGVSFEGRQDIIGGLRTGVSLDLIRQPENPHDSNAIAVYYGALPLGYIRKGIAVHLAPAIDAGARYRANVASLTGGGQKHRGVNIFVERDAVGTLAQRDRTGEELRRAWDGDAERIRHALIGANQPHAAQRDVLERVAAGKNTLAVLGTGRGKSFCFQFSAALRAFTAGAKTLVIYPLRALTNDQYEALMRTLDPLGLRIYRANGSIDNDEREDLFQALRDGAWDVMLATPEFLDFHRDAFAGSSRPAFVVVDEAHHVHESRHRPAYARLSATIAQLGHPQVLALTATAGDDAFAKIVSTLDIEAWVIDPTIRENLHVCDARNREDKVAYLRGIFGDGGKGIVYCNSRKDASEVAGALRNAIGNEVMFYHAGMPTADRHDVERFFREGGLRVVVATSAFGEGIDLPDVEHVVLFHLNFDFAEFNQQAGRAGRNGAPAKIHLLYGDSDRRLNDYLIDVDAPTLPVLREIYRGMRELARDGVLRKGNADIAELLGRDKVRDRTIGAALRIFGDSKLVDVSEDDEGRFVRFLPVSGRVDMQQNERFAEGESIRESFDRFCALALSAPAETLERIINRPIYPSRVQLVR